MKTQRLKTPFNTIITFFVLSVIIAMGANVTKADTTSTDNDILNKSSKAFVNVVKKVAPAVVHIRVEKTTSSPTNAQSSEDIFNNPFFEQFFGPQFRRQHPGPKRQQQHKQVGLGSGFIISKDGLILTNNHVIEDADIIKVSLADDHEFVAKVIGTDPQTDVALIKIEDPENLPVLKLGDSDALEVGEWVIAIGNPFGLTQTVTVGVVSAKGRSSVGINQYENFIQTDAAINPGNSGGPLINVHGEVIGINTALFSKTGGYMGIGFAIPINMAQSVENQLQKNGKVTRGWLGVVIQNIDKELAESFNLKQTGGILISEVQKDSPADKAGLKQGDVIISLNETVLKDVSELRNRIALIAPESKAKLYIIRDGEDKNLTVIIGEQPSDFGKGTVSSAGKNSLEDFGLTLQDLTQELADKLGYEKNSGVVISDVQPDSSAAAEGLKPGYLIMEVNRYRINNLEELRAVLKQTPDTKRILIRVRAGDYSRYVVLSAQ